MGIVSESSKHKKKNSHISAADMVETKTPAVEPQQEKIWTEREIDAMSIQDFDKYEEEIDLAMSEGRVVA